MSVAPQCNLGIQGILSEKSICWLCIFLKILHLWSKLICLASAALLYNLRTKSVSSAACSACRLTNRSSIRQQSQKELKAEEQNKIKTHNLHNRETRKPNLERLEALPSVCLWPYLGKYFPQMASKKVVPCCNKENPALSPWNTHVMLPNSGLQGPRSCSGHEIDLLWSLHQTHANESHRGSRVALNSCQ